MTPLQSYRIYGPSVKKPSFFSYAIPYPTSFAFLGLFPKWKNKPTRKAIKPFPSDLQSKLETCHEENQKASDGIAKERH